MRYRCTALRTRYQVPVCQAIPGAPVDATVVAAFFAACAPIELDAYAQVVSTQQAHERHLAHAEQQHLERLRYEAELARRQFTRVDPDNRLVAAELEGRWAALRALKEAEAAMSARAHGQRASPLRALPADLVARFQVVGQHLPQLAAALERSAHLIYHRIANGTITVDRDPQSKAFLFPDRPETLLQFRQLRDGARQTLCFRHGQTGPEDAC